MPYSKLAVSIFIHACTEGKRQWEDMTTEGEDKPNHVSATTKVHLQ